MNNDPALGTRLRQLKGMSGYYDLMQLSQGLVNQATAQLVDFPGWDTQQIATLKARAQAAKEFHQLLFASVEAAINLSIQPPVEPEPNINDRNAANHADALREAFMATNDADTRIPGSY